MQGQARFPAAHDDRLLDTPDRMRRGLADGPGLQQGADEAACRAVEAGRFRAVQFDQAVVDAQAGPGRPGTCSDEGHLHRTAAQRGAAGGAGHPADVGRQAGRTGQVGAHEDGPCSRRGRQEPQMDGLAGEDGGAGHGGGTSDGSLLTDAVPSHVGPLIAGVAWEPGRSPSRATGRAWFVAWVTSWRGSSRSA